MSPAFRSWIVLLHRWVGLPAGVSLWVLCATGSLAVFSTEIQQWMQPQAALSAAETAEGLTQAGRLMAEEQHKNHIAFLRTPLERDPVFRLWKYDGYVLHGPALHPSTGLPLPTRDVVGGSFFVTLHDCFYIPNLWGRSLVALAGGAMLVALITGVILQFRRFFSDLLLFRPHAAPHRWWLDLHLLIGTLALPVLMIVSLSGVILQIETLTYSPPKAQKPPHSSHTVPPLLSDSLVALEKQGQHLWGKTQGGFFMSFGNETFLYHPDSTSFCIARARISATHPLPESTPTCPSLESIMAGIHNMRWAGLTMRWLYFLTGIAGALLVGSGLILFYKTEKRHLKETHYASSFALRLLYGVNTACLLGFPIASLGLLWSTRLPNWPTLNNLPWETGVFFTLWAASLIHALAAPRAASLQLLILSIVSAGLFPLDWLTRPWATARPLLFLSVDSCGLFIAIAALTAYRKMQRL